MILFYSPGTCALSEIVLLQWLGEPHRLCRLGREERKGAAYRAAVNPQGQVPALLHRVDGAPEVLTENAAILLRLADLRPDLGLLPTAGTSDRVRVYRWLSWLDSGYHMAHAPWFAPQRFAADPAWHDAIRAQALEVVREQVAVLDAHLAGRDHVLLGQRNALDAYVFAMARWSEDALDHARHFPHVKRFLDRMRDDDGVRTALAIEAGDTLAHGPLSGHLAWADALDVDGRLRADLLR